MTERPKLQAPVPWARPVPRASITHALLLLSVVIGGSELSASDVAPPRVTIGEVRTALASPMIREHAVQVVGTLTSEPMSNNYGEILAFLQDESAGISLISRDGRLISGKYRRGDLLRITGTPLRNLETDDIVVSSVSKLGSYQLPFAPRIHVVDALLGHYAGRYLLIVMDAGRKLGPSDEAYIRSLEEAGAVCSVPRSAA